MPELEERQARIEGTLEQLEKRVSRIEVQLEEFRKEVRQEISEIRKEISTNFRWSVGMWIAIMLAIVGLYFKG
jgi:predicted  nucleic acid-binding Zn-ribbon protein